MIGRRKTPIPDGNGSLVFKFTLIQGRSTIEQSFPSLSLVELSSEALLDSFQKTRVKRVQEIPWGIRALEASYDGNLVKSMIKLLFLDQKTTFCYIFNDAQTEEKTADSLLQLSQFLVDGESTPVLTPIAVKEKVSSGIKLILSKKSAKKSDHKKAIDKTSSRIEENSRKKELFR